MYASKEYYHFPYKKAQCGLVLDFGKSSPVRYLWYPDTADNRHYLWANKCNHAKRIFIGFKNDWYSIDDFMFFYNNKKYNYEEIKTNVYKKIK